MSFQDFARTYFYVFFWWNGVTFSKIKYLKRAVTLFLKLNTTAPILGLSNEILCILVAKGAAKMPELKFGSRKKIYMCLHSKYRWWNKNVRFFFGPPNLTSGNFAAPWATRMHSILFGSTDIRAIAGATEGMKNRWG